MKIKLREIAHSRSGDKGNRSNISVIPFDTAHYPHLCRVLTADAVRRHFQGIVAGEVARYELPAISALNFVLDNALGGGVTRSLSLDAHGKSLSSAMLEMEVEAPAGAAGATGRCAPVEHLPKAEDFLLWPPNVQAHGYRIVDRLFNSRTIRRSGSPTPLVYGAPLEVEYDAAGVACGIPGFMDRNAISGLLVIKDGTVRVERYGLGLQPCDRWSTMSTVKSITATLVGVAVKDGAIGSLDDSVTRYVPTLRGSAYEAVSIRDLLTMSSGVAWNEDYADKHSHVNRYSKSLADGIPGGVFELLRGLPRAHPPGVHWHYNTGDTFLLGAALRSAVGMPLAEYLSKRIWGPCGMEFDAFYTLESPEGLEIGGSRAGVALRDFGRFAMFLLDEGRVDGTSMLPQGWNDEAAAMTFVFTDKQKAESPDITSGSLGGYGYSWWIAEDGAMIAAGFAGQRIYVNRRQQLAIITLGAFPEPGFRGPGDHDRRAEVVRFTEAVKAALC
ncbi:serine hydrolase domain-containing protein [Stenotrophomonas mori]|uniref:Beta-lactamase family protein n=1 Tax=Stenotrophomonas mori TaxID=2871096 RepID=A0ABT0SHQ3_9GAMM|nr:serine hydrolase domain-containing protein [Stenotrophomonas mori]MCL7714836.1 beta-lactamase family protein [Stenotrophomonas mori]